MGNQRGCQIRITSDNHQESLSGRNGFFKKTFRRMMPLAAGGMILLSAGTAKAFELSGFGRMDGSRIEKGSEYVSVQNRIAGVRINCEPKKEYCGKAELSYFNNSKDAKVVAPSQIVTERIVIQQSISIMRADDTLSIVPMGFKMTTLTQSGNDYNAHFDVTDTGTGEMSSLDIRVGDKAPFLWKGKLYIVETEGDNLLVSPQTIYVRVARVQENSRNGYTSLYPSIQEEGIGGSVSFGTGSEKRYGWNAGMRMRGIRRHTSLILETEQASYANQIEPEHIILPGFMLSGWFHDVNASFEADHENQAGNIEFSLKRLSVMLRMAREIIKGDMIYWRNETMTGVLEIDLLNDKNGFIKLLLGGGTTKNRISVDGHYSDQFNSISTSGSTTLKWNPVIVGVNIGNGPTRLNIEGATDSKNKRWTARFTRRF